MTSSSQAKQAQTSKHPDEFMGLLLVYLSAFVPVSDTTTESKLAGDKLSSILRTDAWQSIDVLVEQFFKGSAESGFPTTLAG
nr:hypothetical protein Iba_chr15cCG2610 [Ipomoea batatas]